MSVTEQMMNRNVKQTAESQHKNACVMLNDHGHEVHITKAMVVAACQQLLNQCRSIKN